MKTRELFGMTVTEITAPTQRRLFEKLAKFAKAGHGITTVDITFNEDSGEETALVVWA